MCYCAHVEIREQLSGVSNPSSCEVWGVRLASKYLSAKPSLWPTLVFSSPPFMSKAFKIKTFSSKTQCCPIPLTYPRRSYWSSHRAEWAIYMGCWSWGYTRAVRIIQVSKRYKSLGLGWRRERRQHMLDIFHRKKGPGPHCYLGQNDNDFHSLLLLTAYMHIYKVIIITSHWQGL